MLNCKYGPKVAVLGTLGYEPTVQLSKLGELSGQSNPTALSVIERMHIEEFER